MPWGLPEADKSAVGAINRPLRACPGYFVNVHNRPLRCVVPLCYNVGRVQSCRYGRSNEGITCPPGRVPVPQKGNPIRLSCHPERREGSAHRDRPFATLRVTTRSCTGRFLRRQWRHRRHRRQWRQVSPRTEAPTKYLYALHCVPLKGATRPYTPVPSLRG
jgi:hypothetical protein